MLRQNPSFVHAPSPRSSRIVFSVVVVAALSACGGGGGSGLSNPGNPIFQLLDASNGFGQLLPHTVARLGANGQPTSTILSIRTRGDLLANVTPQNPVRPVVSFPADPVLPSHRAGNHFFSARFTAPLDLTSLFSLSGAGGLTGAATLTARSPGAGGAEVVPARVFVDGWTLVNDGGAAHLARWLERDATTGEVRVLDPRAVGFPGAPGSEFTNGAELVRPDTLVFVADADSDLATLETFPSGRELLLRLETALMSSTGAHLALPALAATTVGNDALGPEIATSEPPLSQPAITPGNGDGGVDPSTSVRVRFTEPVQPFSVGPLPGPVPIPSNSIGIEFGPSTQRVPVVFTALPPSVFDLSTYDLTPAYAFPGEGPAAAQCGVFNRIDVSVRSHRVEDLAANKNVLAAQTFFTTGEGPGLVNAPVAPAAIYVARTGSAPALSVVDLDGFGQSTGDPRHDPLHPTEGETNFVHNPNYVLQAGSLIPPLVAGQCTVDGGSSGAFTLTRDSALDDRLARAPLLHSAGDMMIGHSLDGVFNLGPAPYGCQAGQGNLCATDGRKHIMPTINGNTMGPPLVTGIQPGTPTYVGAENLICWSPHPNPPALVFPPPCLSPMIGGQEPTSVDSIMLAGLTNQLAPGDALGDPLAGIPPSGLLTPEQNTFFEGPSTPKPTLAQCTDYSIRQQIGHFLYVIDRERHEVVVFNSNRMTVLDRIELPDPTTLAMSPNVNLLAVSNQVADTVSFIDIDPQSSSFHQVVHEIVVGLHPRGMAWDPSNEDLLVACEGDNSLVIVSASSLQVRKVVHSQMTQPFDVAITERQVCWGYSRNVYFAWVIGRDGSLALFESGPNSVNGWGYDDVIGVAPYRLQRPKAIQPDQTDMRSAVWVAHEGALDPLTGASGAIGTGALTKVAIVSGPMGVQGFSPFAGPNLRDMAFGAPVSLGVNRLSGLPVDIAFDDLRNWGGTRTFTNAFSAGAPVILNGKSLIRGACPNVGPTNHPRYLFAAVPNPTTGTGVIDVVRVDQGGGRIDTNAWRPGVQSIPAPGVAVLMDYFRQ